jgi:hypothetical protein
VEDIGRRGAFVGFGNTAPGTQADVFGLAQRRVKGTVAAGGSGNFSPRTGAGYVAYKKPDYAHALSRSGTDLLMLLFETYGGWSEPVVRLFRRMQDTVRNKLTKRQYENEVSCSELVDVDVARAAGTAPVGGGAHSFGVGDRDRDAVCWGWGRGALL